MNVKDVTAIVGGFYAMTAEFLRSLFRRPFQDCSS
jgi:hypothetical protein